MKNITKSIAVHEDVYEQLRLAAQERDGMSIEQLAESLLRAGLDSDILRTDAYKQHDTEQIQKRLSALGYLE